MEELNWQAFGFPGVGFLPPWKPAEGLRKALAERRLPFVETWDADAIASTESLPLFGECGGGREFCRSFDQELRSVAERYLNHTKLDLTDPEEWSDPLWTWEELLLAAAEGEERRIADPEKGDLSPEWNLDWALQRMRAINLLCYAPVDYQYSYLSGSTHDGKPSSPSASIASALKGARESVSSGAPVSYVTNIYGPDHGWRKGSYCCDVTICKQIFAVLPENFIPDGNVWLFMRVAGPGGDDANFSGSGVSLGMNRFLADADGVFVTFPDSDIGSGVEWPTTDHNTYGGWLSTWCGAFADYSSLFQFKEDDGDEP